jgi:hypothetical protein
MHRHAANPFVVSCGPSRTAAGARGIVRRRGAEHGVGRFCRRVERNFVPAAGSAARAGKDG